MARRYRLVFDHTWTDEKFARLTPAGKLVALYVLTAQSNRCGIFVFSPAMAAEQTGLDYDPREFRRPVEPSPNGSSPGGHREVGGSSPGGQAEVGGSLFRAFREVLDTLDWRWDEAARVLYIPSWWKHNRPDHASILKGCLRDLDGLPQTTLLVEFVANERHIDEKLLDTFRGAVREVTGRSGGPPPALTPSPSPSPSLNTPLPPKGGKRGQTKSGRPKTDPEADPRFLRFWAAYPLRRKTKRAGCAKKFAEIDPDPATLEAMLAALERQKQSRDWLKDDGEYIPGPLPWLNGKRWQDETSAPQAAPARPFTAADADKLDAGVRR